MKLIDKYRWPIVVGVIILVMGIIAFNSNTGESDDQTKKDEAKAASQQQQKNAEQAKKEEATKKAAIATNFIYTARAGDSYSVLARKAVQAYVGETKTKLSQAQIIAAETQLTIAAGSPLLEVHQKVTLTTTSVASAVATAQKLTVQQQALWQTYVPYADFDTSKNG